MAIQPLTHYAVLDLGSNSFHMLIAQEQDQLRVVDKLKEPVRLAMGLDADGNVDQDAIDRALACLGRFAQRVEELPEPHVRVVATNTFRRAKNGKKLRKRVSGILGHPVEVLSGDEEARLIYLGVNWGRSDPGRRKLVVDIGGGSTEMIVGRDAAIENLHSLFMGCVGYTKKFFANGDLAEANFGEARTAALLELRPVKRGYVQTDVDLVLGVSGTCNAIGEILKANEWTDGGIDRSGLAKLRKAMLKAKTLDRLKLEGLSEDRRPVIAAGAAILDAVFEALDLTEMRPVLGALREGVLLDMIGREHHQDTRYATVDMLMSRFQIDLAQSERVRATAKALIKQLDIQKDIDGFKPARFLKWAAQLHELGLMLAYTGHHKHGAYFLANAALAGFSRDDKLLLSTLVRCHRRKLPPNPFVELSGRHEENAPLLTVLLRLAVLLNRGRSEVPPPQLSGDPREGSIELVFEGKWLQEHPLTLADLKEEGGYLRELGVKLKYRDS